MAIFRQYIAPLLIVLVFVFALVAVGIRSFLPADMAAPAPVENVSPPTKITSQNNLPSEAGFATSLSSLMRGLPQEAILSGQFY